MAGSQNGRCLWSCAIAENFGFRGLIGLSGLGFFRSFWGNAKKGNKKKLKVGLLTFSVNPNI
jgi:hypothetical protein